MKKRNFLLLVGLFLPLKEIIIKADLHSDRGRQVELANQGRQLAEKYIAEHPNEAAGYYYRAQALGIAQKNSVFGYPARLRAMLKDWEKVKELDPTFDYGGPYRMFAEVYIALPRHFGPKDLRRDLPKAIAHLQKAIAISDYPTNHLDLAEAYLKAKEEKKAKAQLEIAKKVLPKWKNDPYYKNWLQSLSVSD